MDQTYLLYQFNSPKTQTLKMQRFITHLLLLLFLFKPLPAQIAPTWVSCPQVRAGSNNVVTTLSGSTTTSTITSTFSTAFAAAPNIAYGVQNYQGSDHMRREEWQLMKASLSASAFGYKLRLMNSDTKIYLFSIRYFAISKTFPYKLNIFQNFPVYYKVNFRNVSSKSSSMATFTNVINFTALANNNGHTYNTFSNPLTNNKVVLFVTMFRYQGSQDATSTTLNPLTTTTATNILSTTTFSIVVTNGIKSQFHDLKYCMIIYDELNIISSGQYMLVSQKLTFPASTGGFIPIPQIFLNGIMIGGFLQFKTSSTSKAFPHFNIIYQNNSGGTFGAYMPPSVPRNSNPPFTQYSFALLYMKAWICPSNLVFNYSSDLCVGCPISNCLTCLNITHCQQCDSANGYYLNPTAPSQKQCSLCSVNNCVTCPTPSICTVCDQLYNYFLSNNTCVLCSIPNCINCSSLTTCRVCDSDFGYFINPSSTGASDACINCQVIPFCETCVSLTNCTLCNVTAGYILNSARSTTADQCILCNALYCLQCSNLTSCTLCDQPNGYYKNTTSGLCQFCQIPSCVQCGSLTICLTCNTSFGYFLNSSATLASEQCVFCPVNQCIQCLSLTQCRTCNQNNSFFLNSTDFKCYQCPIFQCLQCANLYTCITCNSSANYFLNSAGQCQMPPKVCGDNHLESPEQCDDGNLKNNDGCSSLCFIQPNYQCQANNLGGFFNSLCYYVGELTLEVTNIQKIDYKNQILIQIEIGPKGLPFWETVDYSFMVILSNVSFFDSYQVVKNSNGTVSVFANYKTDIQDMNITVELNPSLSGDQILSRLNSTFKTFAVKPNDNEAAIYYEQEIYNISKAVSIFSMAIGGVFIVAFMVGIFLKRLIGTQMMEVIQISYLSLMGLSDLNPVFKSLSNMWFVNGFNIFYLNNYSMNNISLPKQISSLHLSAFFLENYNATGLFIIIAYLAALIIRILSCTIFKQNNEKYIKLAKRCACQFAFTVLMFSGLIIAVSLALQAKYGISQLNDVMSFVSIICAAIFLLLLILYFGLVIKFPLYFGQFTYFFKASTQNKYIPDSDLRMMDQNVNFTKNGIIYQYYKGQFWGFLKLSGLITISIYTFMAILTLIIRPYRYLKHTIRFISNLGISIIIQIIYLGYKVTPLEEQKYKKFWYYLPILVCILLLLCVGYNIGFIVYEMCRNKDNQQEEVGQFKKLSNITTTTQAEEILKNNMRIVQKSISDVMSKQVQALQEKKKMLQQQKQILRNIKTKKDFRPQPIIQEPGNQLKIESMYTMI